MPALHVNDKDFDTVVLNADKPVLVDFYANWCGPCRMMAPVLDEVADDLAGRAIVVKVNVDEAPQAAQRYGVQSIPAFILFQNGEVKSTAQGALPKESLVASVNDVLTVA